jgi:hypothetical protein
MATAFTCPACKAALKLARDIPAGKLIKCPKCARAVRVPEEEPELEEDAELEEEEAPPPPKKCREQIKPARPAAKARVEEDEDEEEDEAPPPKKGRAPIKPTKPAAKARRDEDDEDEEDEDEAPPPKKGREQVKAGRPAAKSRRDEDDDEDEDERPRKRRPGKKGRDRDQGGSGMMRTIIGLVVLVILLIVVAIVFYLRRDVIFGTGSEAPAPKEKPPGPVVKAPISKQKQKDTKQKQPDAQPEQKPDLVFTAKDLSMEYFADPEAAGRKYRGKTLEVTGVVFNVRFLGSGELMLSLEGGTSTKGEGLLIACNFRPTHEAQALKLAGNQTVKIRGKGSFVGLLDCQVVTAGANTASVVTATQLAKEYNADVKATQQRYKNQAMLIEGVVIKIERSGAGGYDLTLAGENKDRSIRVGMTLMSSTPERLTKRYEAIAPGQTVRVRGFSANFLQPFTIDLRESALALDDE